MTDTITVDHSLAHEPTTRELFRIPLQNFPKNLLPSCIDLTESITFFILTNDMLKWLLERGENQADPDSHLRLCAILQGASRRMPRLNAAFTFDGDNLYISVTPPDFVLDD